MKKTIVAILLLAAPAAAQAENWRVVSYDQTTVQYVDQDTIDRSGPRVRFTREIRLHRPDSVGGQRFDRIVQVAEVACAERRLFSLSLTAMLGDAVVHRDGPWSESEEMLPGTNLGGTHGAVCENEWGSSTIADRAAENRRLQALTPGKPSAR